MLVRMVKNTAWESGPGAEVECQTVSSERSQSRRGAGTSTGQHSVPTGVIQPFSVIMQICPRLYKPSIMCTVFRARVLLLRALWRVFAWHDRAGACLPATNARLKTTSYVIHVWCPSLLQAGHRSEVCFLMRSIMSALAANEGKTCYQGTSLGMTL